MVSRAWNICQKIFLTNYNKKQANGSASKEKKSEMVGAPISSVSSSNNNANQDASGKWSITAKNESAEPIQWISFLADHKPRVHGFDSEIMSLKKLLGTREDGDKFKAVGVVGTRGVGKTTLCQEFYRRLTEEQPKETGSPTFSPRVWVSMPKPSRKKEDTGRKIAVLERILKSLGFDQEEKIMDVTGDFASSNDDGKLIVLLYVLRLRLLGKKYLVVLDDVQEADSWCKKLFESVPLPSKSDPGVRLASGLPKESGGTVIVTSTEETAAKMMIGDGNLHRLLPLESDNTSLWKIFRDAVDGLQPELNMEILKEKIMKNCEELQFFGKSIDMMKILEEKVVSKCNGLPLAAILMAKTMPEQVVLMEKRKEKRVKEAQNKGGSKEKTDEPQKEDTGGKVGRVQDDQGGPKPSAEMLEGPNQGQEGKSADEETLGKEEETEEKEDVQEKEEAKGTDDQTQEVAKHDAEVASQKKDDQGEGKEGEAEKIPEEAKQVQGEDHGHDAKVESPKKDEDQKTKETKDHEVEAPKKEEEAPKEAKETQVQGEDHGLHDAEVGSPNKDEDQKATETKDHEVVAPKKLEEEGPKEVMETQVQAEALEKKEELPEKQEHVQEEAKAAS